VFGRHCSVVFCRYHLQIFLRNVPNSWSKYPAKLCTVYCITDGATAAVTCTEGSMEILSVSIRERERRRIVAPECYVNPVT
jgi:hypothetical protein